MPLSAKTLANLQKIADAQAVVNEMMRKHENAQQEIVKLNAAIAQKAIAESIPKIDPMELVPKKGLDYFTPEEQTNFLEAATPVKGVDYFDGQDGQDGENGTDGKDGEDGYTPVKGIDYFDGEDGTDGKDGVANMEDVTKEITTSLQVHTDTFDHTLIDPFLLGTNRIDETGMEKGMFIRYAGDKKIVYETIKQVAQQFEPFYSQNRNWGKGGLTVTEVDGSPNVVVNTIKFSNGTVTDNGNGTATVTNSGGLSSIAAYNILSNNTNAAAVPVATQQLILGTPGYTSSGYNIGQFTVNQNSFAQISLQNISSGGSASSDFVVTSDTGNDSTNYADFGINNSTGASTPFSSALAAYLYTVTNELDIGALGSSGVVNIYTTGGAAAPKLAATFNASQGLSVVGSISASNLSGTNTGDQTSVSGNAGTVTTNANLTGDVTSVGNATTLTNAPVIAKVLTGFVSGSGTVTATDSILTAFQKVVGNISSLVTGVSSVFGRTGAVTATSGDYTTAQVTESGNLYFTNARAIASTLTGYVSGAGTVAATDTILQAIQKLNGNAAALVTGVSSVFGRTGAVTAQSGDYTATQVGLGSVTNDAQTKAAIVPNTAPTAGQILVGNAGGTAYAPSTLSGSGATISLASTGVMTISAIANASLANTAVANLSGTNTGDQTSVSGNAGTVTTISGKIAAGSNTTLAGGGTTGSPYTVSIPQSVATSASPQFNNLGLGAAVGASNGINVATSLSGSATQIAVNMQPTISSACTTAGIGNASYLNYSAGSYTCANGYDFYAYNPGKGAGAAITNLYGYYAENLTAGANNYAFYSVGSAQSVFGGAVSVGGNLSVLGSAMALGGTAVPQYGMNVAGTLTGATTQIAVNMQPTVDSGCTGAAMGNAAYIKTAAAAFTCPAVYDYYAYNCSKGAGSTVTNHYGYYVESLSSGVNNYAFYSAGNNPSVFGGTVSVGGKVNSYNGVTTAGNGVPSIYGSGRTVGATAAVASVATYTVGASDGSFIVSANVLVTTATTHAFTVTVAYTDEGNTARVLTLQFSNLAGTLLTSIANAAGAVPYEGVPVHIRCKAATTITIASAAGGVYTSVAYNIEGTITQIA